MGRKRIHEDCAAKSKAYRCRKEASGRFIRVFVPSDIDKQLRLTRCARRLVQRAVQTEELKEHALDTVYYFLETATHMAFILKEGGKEVSMNPLISKILSLYFGQASAWFARCKLLFGASLLDRQSRIKSYVSVLDECMKSIRTVIDIKLYDSLMAEIQIMREWIADVENEMRSKHLSKKT